MPQQLIRVRPTKIELIKLKRRRKLAVKIQKIVKDRLSILIMEFLQLVRETVAARKKSLTDFKEAYRALSVTSGYHGYLALEKELVASERDMSLASGTRNIAGVRIPSVELEKDEKTIRSYNAADTSGWVDHTADEFEKCLEAIVELAELQTSLEILGREINRTKRIVNALEYMIIPSFEATIKFLSMKFEERDREEKSRLKRVKMLLEQKE